MALKRKITETEFQSVAALARSGFKGKTISEKTKLAPSSVAKILADVEKDQLQLAKYSENRLAVLQKGQLTAASIQQRILDSFALKLNKMTNSEKISLYKVLTADFAVKFDKERLEKGESTENISKVVKLIRQIKRTGKIEEEIKQLEPASPVETNLQIEDQGAKNGTDENNRKDGKQTDSQSAATAQKLRSIQSNIGSGILGPVQNPGLLKQSG
jgi:DNA-binding MarR family transcriptional regulator